MANVVLTSAGLDYVLSASAFDSILIRVGYFVPVYDYRIDGTIQSEASAFSAIANPALTAPIGEILWNVSARNYTQSFNNEYIISASNYGSAGTYTSPFQTFSGPINLLNGVPLSKHLSGSSLVGDGTDWTGISGTSVGNGNGRPTNTQSDFFVTQDYYPVRISGTDDLAGNWRCVINKDIGKIRFNKIALYAVAVDSSTQVVIGSEVFFAEAYLYEPITKTGLAADGFDSLVLDFQLDLHAISANWNEVFIGSSADYWAPVPNGLHSPSKISVGHFGNVNKEPQATVHIGRIKDDRGNYENVPHVKMEGVTSAVGGVITTQNFDMNFVPIVSGVSSQLLLSADTPLLSISPMTKTNIGTTTYPLYSIYVSGSPVSPFVDFLSGSYYFLLSKDNYINMARERIYFNDSASNIAGSVNHRNTFFGGDLVRDKNDLLVQTKEGNVYILAGSTQQVGNGQNNALRHENAVADVLSQTALSSTTNWTTTSITNIVARGGIRNFGPVELNYIPNNPTVYPNTQGGILSTKKDTMLIMAGFTSAVGYTYETLYDGMLNCFNTMPTNWDPLGTFITTASKLFIVAKNIISWGDLKPGINNNFNLGSSTTFWNNIYSKSLKLDLSTLDEIVNSNLYGLNVIGKLTIPPTGSIPAINTYLSKNSTYIYNNIYIGKNSSNVINPIDEIYAKTISATNIIYNNMNGLSANFNKITSTNIIATDAIVSDRLISNYIDAYTFTPNVVIVGDNYNVRASDFVVVVVTPNVVITLPYASRCKMLIIKKITGANGYIKLQAQNGDTIEDGTYYQSENGNGGSSYILVSISNNIWSIVASLKLEGSKNLTEQHINS